MTTTTETATRHPIAAPAGGGPVLGDVAPAMRLPVADRALRRLTTVGH